MNQHQISRSAEKTTPASLAKEQVVSNAATELAICKLFVEPCGAANLAQKLSALLIAEHNQHGQNCCIKTLRAGISLTLRGILTGELDSNTASTAAERLLHFVDTTAPFNDELRAINCQEKRKVGLLHILQSELENLPRSSQANSATEKIAAWVIEQMTSDTFLLPPVPNSMSEINCSDLKDFAKQIIQAWEAARSDGSKKQLASSSSVKLPFNVQLAVTVSQEYLIARLFLEKFHFQYAPRRGRNDQPADTLKSALDVAGQRLKHVCKLKQRAEYAANPDSFLRPAS